MDVTVQRLHFIILTLISQIRSQFPPNGVLMLRNAFLVHIIRCQRHLLTFPAYIHLLL